MGEEVTRRAGRFLFLSSAPLRSERGDRSDRAERRFDAQYRIGWRVVAANNRPLGRSATTFPSLDDAVRAATEMHRQPELITSGVLFDPELGHWEWSAALAGQPAAVCVHAYRRRVECVRAVSQFLTVVRDSVPDGQDVRHLGPNALRVYEAEPSSLRYDRRRPSPVATARSGSRPVVRSVRPSRVVTS
jgi:hypothetical protein